MQFEELNKILLSIKPDKHIYGGKRGSEENIKMKIILPLLQALGWDLVTDMQFEHIGADIVLYHDATPLIIIETKSWDEKKNITRHFRQCSKYCLKIKTPWFVISSGFYTAFYNYLLHEKGKPLPEPLLHVTFNQLVGNEGEKHFEKINSYLGKKSFLNEKIPHSEVERLLGKNKLEIAEIEFKREAENFRETIKSIKLTNDEYYKRASRHPEEIKNALLFLLQEITKNDGKYNLSIHHESKSIGIQYNLHEENIGLFGLYPDDAHVSFHWDGWEKLKVNSSTIKELTKFRGKVQSKKWAEDLINLMNPILKEIKG